ncbi:hypothetical protein [Streptomyces sp. NPDC058955]|uniref:hypothetical protein n=1 Tax=unclassified Streptomyces TaxID=2593676 RepID=UPI00365118EF
MPVPSTPAPTASAPSARSRRRARVPGPAAPVAPETGGPAGPGAGPRGDVGAEPGAAADDVVRWAVFCCALVPLVLIAFGTSLGGAGGAALGLVSVTAACRLLLRRAERGLRTEGAAGGTGAGGRRRG